MGLKSTAQIHESRGDNNEKDIFTDKYDSHVTTLWMYHNP